MVSDALTSVNELKVYESASKNTFCQLILKKLVLINVNKF